MKRFAETKDDAIVEIPEIVGVSPIGVQPQPAIGVTLDIPDVRIAIGISF